MSRLRHSALQSVPGIALPGLASYLAFVVIGRSDSTETLGYVSLAWVITNVCSAMVGLGPAHTALRCISAGDRSDEVRARFRSLVLLRSLALAGVVLLVGVLLPLVTSSEAGPMLVLAAPWLVGQSLVLFESETLKAAGSFTGASILLSGRAVVGWSASAAAAATIGGLPAAILPTAIVGLAFGLGAGRGRFERATDEDRRSARTIGRPVGQMSLASYSLGYGDYFVVQLLLGPSAVATYALGYQLGAGVIELLTAPITGAALPRVVTKWNQGQAGRDEAEHTAVRLGGLVLGITSLVIAAVLALRQTGVFDLISSDPRLPTITAIVAMAVGLQAITRLAYGFLLARGRTSWALRSFIVAGVLNLIAAVLLTWAFGLIGTAVATLLGYGALALISVWAVKTP